MKGIPFRRSIFMPLVASFGMVMAISAIAQEVKITAADPQFEELPSPQVDVGGVSKKFKPKNWLEMEVEFEIQAKSKKDVPKSGFYDEVTVKWYIAMKDPDQPSKLILLEKEVKHVNVPDGEKVFSSVYLSPSSVMRLNNGSDRGGKNSVEVVGGEIQYKGRPLARFTSKSIKGWPGKPWWDSSSLSRANNIPLLSKNETPFSMLWYDRYAEIEEERR